MYDSESDIVEIIEDNDNGELDLLWVDIVFV